MKVNYQEVFPKRLRELRIARNKRQDDLADYLGVGRSSIAMYEGGRNFPLTETFIGIAEYLGTSIDYLLGLTHDPEPFNSRDRQSISIESLKDLPLVYHGRVLTDDQKNHIALLLQSMLAIQGSTHPDNSQ